MRTIPLWLWAFIVFGSTIHVSGVWERVRVDVNGSPLVPVSVHWEDGRQLTAEERAELAALFQ